MARPYNKRVLPQTEETATEKSVAVSVSAGGMPFGVVDVPTDVEKLNEVSSISENTEARAPESESSPAVEAEKSSGVGEDREAVNAAESDITEWLTAHPVNAEVPHGNLSARVAAAALKASLVGFPEVAFPLNQVELAIGELRMAIPKILPAVDADLQADLQDLLKLL